MTDAEFQEAVRRGNEAVANKPGIYESWPDFWKCLGCAIVAGAFCWWSIYMILALCSRWSG